MIKIWMLLIIALTLMACHNKAVPVIPARTNFPPAPRSPVKASIENSPEAIAAGKIIFETRCNRCHDLKVTNAYTSERWTVILQSMIPRARLTPDQSIQIRSYIMANAGK